jgi:hypothetical protein
VEQCDRSAPVAVHELVRPRARHARAPDGAGRAAARGGASKRWPTTATLLATARPADPAAPFSGHWWSTPAIAALVTTTRPLPWLGSVELMWQEDSSGPPEASMTPAVCLDDGRPPQRLERVMLRHQRRQQRRVGRRLAFRLIGVRGCLRNARGWRASTTLAPSAVRVLCEPRARARRLCFPEVRSPTRCDEAVSEVISADRRYQEVLEIGGTAGEPGPAAAALDGLARFAVIRGDHAGAGDLADEPNRLHATASRPAPPCERLGRVR